MKGMVLQKTSGITCDLLTTKTRKPPDESFWPLFHRLEHDLVVKIMAMLIPTMIKFSPIQILVSLISSTLIS